MSRGLLAWPVDIEPSWPVFMAWSMSSASPERHSPTMMRSGRMRRALRTSSRIGIAPLPSMFGGRDSSVTTCSWRSCSSAASSIVTIRSSFGMNDERTLSVVVLPEPVPPETKMFRRASTHARRKSNMSAVAVPNRMRSSTVNGEAENFRIVMTGPTRDSGGMMALTREPSVRRASTIGRRLVDAAADRGDDPVDDAHDVVVVLEDDVGELELAGALDVDLARAVDHDFRDRLVAEERLERAEADDLVGDLLEHPDALGAGQGEAFLVDDLAEDLLDLAPDLDLVGQVELRVEVLDDPALDPELDVPERLADGRLGHQPRGRRRRRRAATGRAGSVGRREPRRGAPGAAGPVERSRSASAGTSPTPLSPRGPTLLCDTLIAMRTTTSSGCPCGRLRQPHRRRIADDGLASRRMSWDTCASRLRQEERYAPVEGVDDASAVADDRVVDLPPDRVLDVRHGSECRIRPALASPATVTLPLTPAEAVGATCIRLILSAASTDLADPTSCSSSLLNGLTRNSRAQGSIERRK